MLLDLSPPWEISDMADHTDLRGAALYDALMRLKPSDLAETDWALKAGMNRGFFTNLKKQDISPRSDSLRKLLRVVQKNEADLYDESPESARSVTLPTRSIHLHDDVVEIISLDLSLSMGPGTLIEEFVEEEPVKFDIGLLRAVTRTPLHMLRAVKGVGDSMEPTLRTNDRILIDTSEKMLSRVHGIYWIDHLGAHGIKRLRAMGQGRILIMSDNPAVPDYDVDAEEMRIHGRAIWLMRDL
ncbi:putative transcriptional regulator [Sphingopyxis fribergensis]|uniref:Putative transcriptional regulator n=1 Tax=Sphingopyxis fribergensis TaxID=1515612 RepID=A0A0A7PBE7_9SPHN|nr:S24 family peptidase [Sphingopyxis fribergensis]AJA07426.1 putative transcriptional regulator [Sphingopyxis fribergensis]